MTETGTLHAPMKVEFDYTRSLGPTLSEFMTGLKRRQILGGVLSDGTVAVPPPEYDGVTFDPITELRPGRRRRRRPELGLGAGAGARASRSTGRSRSPRSSSTARTGRSCMRSPSRRQTRSRPACACARVWADETVGAITDIRWFEPEGDWTRDSPRTPRARPVTGIIAPVKLAYDYAASPEESKFFRGLADGKLIGQRCPVCEKVYVPPRGACPVDGVPTTDEVEVADHGTVTTFCIVNVPFTGQQIPIPYVSAYVLLDGADIAFLHLILGIDAADVRMGLRVKAVWKPRDEWGTTIANISHFEPTGEPDADYETYKVHL